MSQTPDGYQLGREMHDEDHYRTYAIAERTVLGAYVENGQCVGEHSARRRLGDLNAAYRLGWTHAMDAVQNRVATP